MIVRVVLLTFYFALGTFSCAQDSPEKSSKSEKPGNQEKSSNQEKSAGEDAAKDPRSDRETREIFFRTLSETRSRGAQEFSYLLFQESVRQEINLSEESATAAREILSQTRSSAERLYEQLKAKKITGEELKVKMQEIMTNADRDIWKTLGESNSKRDRLVALFVQHRHCSAVLNKIVAEKVGLDETRRHEIMGKKEAVEREMFENHSLEAQNPGDRFRAWEKVQKKIDVVVSDMLTAEQRDKLEKLKGEPFAFEELPFPGPPGRGREGGRDRNRRDKEHEEKCRDGERLVGDR